MFAAKIKLVIHRRTRSAERVIKVIEGKWRVFTIMAEDDGVAVAARYIDAPGRADGRRKNEIVDTFEANGFAARLAGNGVEARKNVLIVPKKVKRVVVQER